MTTTEPKTILITGASSGIGAATAQRLAADGHDVIATARRADRLAALAAESTAEGHRLEARALDVTDADAFRRTVDEVVADHGRLDVLVGNAGAMLLSRLDARQVEQWDRMIDVNVRGLLHGIAATLPHFTEQGGGHVVTVASIGAHEVSPTSAVYSATKFAAWALTEGLRQESAPGLRVTTISPGVVESELADHITDDFAADLMRDYRADSISPSAIAASIAFAVDQPSDVDVNEMIVRPTRQR